MYVSCLFWQQMRGTRKKTIAPRWDGIGRDGGQNVGKNLVIDTREHRTIGIRASPAIFLHCSNSNGWNLAGLIQVGCLREIPGIARQDLAVGSVGNLSRACFADDLPVGIGIT